MIEIAPHPLLDLRAFVTTFDQPIGEIASSWSVLQLLSCEAKAPLQATDETRKLIRNLLRHGGFKPTGRSKPASEYLLKAAQEGSLGSINLAVDACNAVSLHSGLPISVVDLDKVCEPLRVDIAEELSSYVFNASGQSIDVGRLLCLIDAEGPCANAVKDSQRTKTTQATQRTLSIIWGTNKSDGLSNKAESWYRELLESSGAKTNDLP